MRTINYRRTPDVAAEVAALTRGEGVDHVLETVGGADLDLSLAAVRIGGSISVIGLIAGRAAEVTTYEFVTKNVTVHGIETGSQEMYAELAAFVDEHGLVPVLDSAHSVTHLRDACATWSAARTSARSSSRSRADQAPVIGTRRAFAGCEPPQRSARSDRGREDRRVLIREATDADWPRIHLFFRAIVAAGETYAYPEGLSADEARALWFGQGRVVVAVEGADGPVLGSAAMGANRPGRGAHVATASFMVDPAHAGRGIGRALGEHVVAWAGGAGFRGIQFNAVVETNTAAVALWRSLGFTVIGTVPEAFRHPTLGYVGLHVMHRALP